MRNGFRSPYAQTRARVPAAIDERVARRRGSVELDAQDLALEALQVLRVRIRRRAGRPGVAEAGVAGADVEEAVGTDARARRRRGCRDRCGCRRAARRGSPDRSRRRRRSRARRGSRGRRRCLRRSEPGRRPAAASRRGRGTRSAANAGSTATPRRPISELVHTGSVSERRLAKPARRGPARGACRPSR